MPRRTLIPLLIAIALVFAACGEDEVAGGGSDAAQTAESLAGELRDVEREVRGELGRLDDGTAERGRAREALDDAEERARELAREARESLPEDDAARADLERAAARVAEAAQVPGDDRAQAEAALDDARERLGEAVSALEDRVPESARGGLEDLRRSLESPS
jgi:chromosome segregation ATPase